MPTGLKLATIYLVIAAGAVAIIVLQWPEAVAKTGYGSAGYTQGLTGTVMLTVILAGIPIVFWAVLVYLALSWLWFRSGEIDAWRARKVLAEVARADASSTSERAVRSQKTFED
jgi:uncharacterized membrane protein